MLIFSHLTSQQKFQEIKQFKDCDTIESDTCAFFNIHDATMIESYFELAKQLQTHEVPYAVIIRGLGYCGAKESDFNISLSPESWFDEPILRNNYWLEKMKLSATNLIPLNMALLMFANFHAKYFILDRNNYHSLFVIQNLANYYLLDTKILAIVESYQQIQQLSWFGTNGNIPQYVGLDGVIEHNMLQ